MTSMEDVGGQLSLAFDQVQQSYLALLRAAEQLADASRQMNALDGSNNPDNSLGESVGLLKNSHHKVIDTMGALATAGNLISTVAAHDSSYNLGEIGGGAPSSLPESLPQPEPWPSENMQTAAEDHNEPTPEELEAYRNQISDINVNMTVEVPVGQILNHYTSGGACEIFTVEGDDTKLIKIPKSPNPDDFESLPPNEFMMRDYVEPLLFARGLDGFEQIVAVMPATDIGPTAVIVERVPGSMLESMTTEQINNIPEEHFDRLFEIFDTAIANNIMPDLTANNIIYNPAKGFTLIDFQLNNDVGVHTSKELGRLFGEMDVLFNNWDSKQPFPESGRTYMRAFRKKYGNEAGDRYKRLLKAQATALNDPYGHRRYSIPDDI